MITQTIDETKPWNADVPVTIKLSGADLLARAPKGAKAAILAKYRQDQSDSQTDYYGHTTPREIVIGWRMTDRESFVALRKAAGTFPPTEHMGPGLDVYTLRAVYVNDAPKDAGQDRHHAGWLHPGALPREDREREYQTAAQAEAARIIAQAAVDARNYDEPHKARVEVACTSVEHRENYSMGGGNYLFSGRGHASGWSVSSYPIAKTDPTSAVSPWGITKSSQMYELWEPATDDNTPTMQDLPAHLGGYGAKSTDPVGPCPNNDAPGYRLRTYHHTKKGADYFQIEIEKRVSTEKWKALTESAKACGGYYSRAWNGVPGGWAFPNASTAAAWAAAEFGESDEPSVAQLRARTPLAEYAVRDAQAEEDRDAENDNNPQKQGEGEHYCRQQERREARTADEVDRQIEFVPPSMGKADMISKLTAGETMKAGGKSPELTWTGLTKAVNEIRPDMGLRLCAQSLAENTRWLDIMAGNKIADKFDTLANGLQKTIDDKKNTNKLTNTPKRQYQAQAAYLDGKNWERCQAAMRVLALAHRAGNVPEQFRNLRTKTEVHEIARKVLDHSGGYYIIRESDRYADESEKGKAFRAWVAYYTTDDDRSAAAVEEQGEKIRNMEEAVRFNRIPGFFPTPPGVIEKMLDAANIQPGMVCLEPSTGKGDLAEAAKARGAELICFEIMGVLADICTAKGLPCERRDFMEAGTPDADGGARGWPFVDLVLMNPPFERSQDQNHVRRAYDWLKPGGRVVAIMSAGVKNNQAARIFREWLEHRGGTMEDLPADSFRDSFNPTGVSCVLVVIDKPEA